ncbi:MAG: sulfite exporter TauE/SafE family protein, partial [Muribaculaceae bacterium]|nr:sulfite exporter TauE/SafE family protein [Muribaculaceae bacterium]
MKHNVYSRKLMRLALIACALVLGLVGGSPQAVAQIIKPIVWNVSVDMESAGAGSVTLSANVADGWHLYGTDIDPTVGPRITDIVFAASPNVQFTDSLVADVTPVVAYDEVFQAELSWWGSDVAFTRHFVVDNATDYYIDVTVAFQGCNDTECLAPAKESFTIRNGAVVDDSTAEHGSAGVASDVFRPEQNRWWQPVDVATSDIADSPWWYIFVWGFLSGLLALLTPCVWPLIPMTMSFFLKKGKSRSEAIRDAMVYGISIVVIYLAMGLIITGIYGSGKLNELSTSAVFNMLFFLLLVVFGISFLGAFDIKLPSRWSNSIDSRAEHTTGYLSIFFMAFTLALVSFSCTGPLIGTLLVEAASLGDRTGPAIGMGAFALALAIPFTLFAIFPSWLKEMPRSGGWLNSVKVVLGFLELALSLKFLSVADMAYGWHILDREVFLALWIVIFVMLGLYLLGKISFSHDSPVERVGIGRFFLALVSWSFAVYLLPGLWGAPLKGV